MVRNVAILVLIAFAAAALVGFAVMGVGPGCIAATLEGIHCTSGMGPFSLATLHIGALHTLTTSTLSVGPLVVLILLATLLAGAVSVGVATPNLTTVVRAPSARLRDSVPYPHATRLTFWLALHEKRDPAPAA